MEGKQQQQKKRSEYIRQKTFKSYSNVFFREDDEFFEWSDVLKNMYAWGREFHHKNTRCEVRFKI